MTEQPKRRRIPFMAHMMRAVLAGEKTQTRRVIPYASGWPAPRTAHLTRSSGRAAVTFRWSGIHRQDVRLPYDVGDILTVIEDWRVSEGFDGLKPSEIHPGVLVQYLADGTTSTGEEISRWGRRRWSQHMPAWASRCSLRVTDLRVQRLQDISGDDIMAEGVGENWEIVAIVGTPTGPSEISGFRYRVAGMHDDHEDGFEEPLDAFVDLWDRINAERGAGWHRNPWVAAYTFERLSDA